MMFVATLNPGRPHASGAIFAAGLLALAELVGRPAYGSQDGAPAARVELRVERPQALTTAWAVLAASLEESVDVSWVYVTVQNATERPVSDAFFYGELYDREGRFCFSGLFDLQKNLEGHRGSLAPGGARTLYSFSGELASAVEPELIRLLPVNPGSPGSGEPFSAAIPIRIPVTLWATGVPVPPGWQRFWMLPPMGQPDAPVLDLALVVADVDSQGRMIGTPVIQALNPAVRDWIEKLRDHLLLRPSMVSFLPQRSQTLILARTVLRRWKAGEPAFNPRTSPWVRDFVNAFQAKELPVVNIVMVYPCPAEASGVAPSGGQAGGWIPQCVEYGGGGTDWSVGIWKPQFAEPHGLR